MDNVQHIRVPLNDGTLITVKVREKRREAEDGVEGIVYALLHPKSLIEIGEYWAPIDQTSA
jgi:hypothetical protein